MKKVLILLMIAPMISFGQCISGDCVNGYGTYIYSGKNEGDKYVGEWKDNKRNGQGTYTFGPNSDYAGDVYRGQSKNDEWHGQGTYTWADGSKYIGSFKNNLMDGLGIMYYFADGKNKGDVFYGEYNEGKKNGLGLYIFNSGKGDLSYYINDKEIKRECEF
tara:strand:- start:385 stop:867 length:483 start_codon:yes stop_codon:yes gene_type:complete